MSVINLRPMDIIREITLKKYPLRDDPIQVGDTVKIFLKIKEGIKERVQVFEGLILKIQGKDFSRSVTVRKISDGVGVEKTIPLSSPNIVQIEILSRSKVRRSRLFYLRKLRGRAARLVVKKDDSLKTIKPSQKNKLKTNTSNENKSSKPSQKNKLKANTSNENKSS